MNQLGFLFSSHDIAIIFTIPITVKPDELDRLPVLNNCPYAFSNCMAKDFLQ